MCYGGMIARKADLVSRKYGIPYEDALETLLVEFDQHSRWTSVFNRPTVPILTESGVVPARWTFLGPWIKDEEAAKTMPGKTGNCRTEEMFEKPTFKSAARKRRCLIPFSGYYDFQHRGKVKVPYIFRRRGGGVFYIGGLWQEWNGPNGTETTFTLCTMPPNRLNLWVHNSNPRQPLLLEDRDEAESWMTPGGPERIAHLIVPRDDGFLEAEETENINGKRVENAPPPLEGMPEGVILKGQKELF